MISPICQGIIFFFHKIVVITKGSDHWHLIKELKSQLKEGFTERGITIGWLLFREVARWASTEYQQIEVFFFIPVVHESTYTKT